MFILELTLRGWGNTDKRCTLTKKDIVMGCHQSDVYDFLVDIIPPVQACTQQELTPRGPQQLTHHPQQEQRNRNKQQQHLLGQPVMAPQPSTLPIDPSAMAAYHLQMQSRPAPTFHLQVSVRGSKGKGQVSLSLWSSVHADAAVHHPAERGGARGGQRSGRAGGGVFRSACHRHRHHCFQMNHYLLSCFKSHFIAADVVVNIIVVLSQRH